MSYFNCFVKHNALKCNGWLSFFGKKLAINFRMIVNAVLLVSKKINVFAKLSGFALGPLNFLQKNFKTFIFDKF